MGRHLVANQLPERLRAYVQGTSMLCLAARDDYEWKLELRVPPEPLYLRGLYVGALGF